MGEVVIRETFYLVKHAEREKKKKSQQRSPTHAQVERANNGAGSVVMRRDEGGGEKEGRKIKISRESSFNQHCFPALPHQPTPLIVNRPINHITL